MALKTFYAKSDYLKMVHTGNSLGMKDNGSGSFAIGSFITLDPAYTSNSGITSSVDPLTFAGTTNTIVNNGSWGRLMPSTADVPAGSTVDVAVLIWGFQGTVSAPLSIDQAITFIDPTSVSHSIAPNPTYSVGPVGTSFYTRAADVTTIVSAAGMGDYAVANIPNRALGSGNGVGWSLVVVYKNSNALPYRNVSIFIGDVSNGGSASVSGFYTPQSGVVAARAFVMALYGDSDAGGDTFTLAGKALSGPRNPATNFFASQVCDYNGNLATIGSFGDRNCTPGISPSLQRAEFDLTNVDASGVLGNGIRSSTVGIGAGGDIITANAIALEINTNSAILNINKTVDKAYANIGNSIIYTLVISNTGTSDALNFLLQDTIPSQVTLVPNTLFVNGVLNGGNIQTGINIGTISKVTGIATVTFEATINGGVANLSTIVNNAYGSFQFISDPLQPTITNGIISNDANTVIFQDLTTIVKSVDKTITVNGMNLLYTIAVNNLNTIASINTVTIVDSIPNTTTFVAGSVSVDGVSVPGANPQTGILVGNIAPNSVGTITFSVLCNGNTGTIPNYAVANYLYNGTINNSMTSNIVNTTYVNISITPVKTVDKVFTIKGQKLIYTIVFKNSSNISLSNAIFKDTIPSGTTFVPNSVKLNGVSTTENPQTGINIVNIQIGDTNTITFEVIVN